MSQPNYEFGLKCRYVRQEINVELNRFARQVETLVRFHEPPRYQHRFKAFDIVHWPHFPVPQLDLLIKHDHPWGVKLFQKYEAVNAVHHLLKRELESEIYWTVTINRFDSGEASNLEELEGLVRTLFGTSAYVSHSALETILDFMCENLSCEVPECTFGRESEYSSRVIEILDRFFKGGNSSAVSGMSRTLDAVFDSHRQKLKREFDALKADARSAVKHKCEFASQNIEARIHLGLDARGNEGFTVNQHNEYEYVSSLKLLWGFLETISNSSGEIDVLREEDEFLITVHEAADYFDTLGHAEFDKKKEERVAKERSNMQGNSRRGKLAGLDSVKQILPVLTFTPEKTPRPQNGYCVYEVFEKLCPDFFEKLQRDHFLRDMYDRDAKRNL